MRLLLCLGAVLGGSRAGLEAQTNGLVVAWGQNSSGQTNVPAGLSNVVAIAGGGHNSLALRSKGTVVAWGANTSGQTNAPTGLGSFVAVAAGSSYTLTVSGGPLRVLLAPGNQTVASGHAVEFRTAVLSLPPLGYQWFFAETNSISGAMGPVLHLTDVQFSESGAYTVVVTNGFGAVTSSPALLRVVGVPPTITIAANTVLDGSGHQLTISGGNAVCVLFVNTNLALTLVNLTIANGRSDKGAALFNEGSVRATDPGGAGRFYRLVMP